MPAYKVWLPTLLICMAPALCARSQCDAPAAESSAMYKVPGRPSSMVLSRDGCYLFVSVDGGREKPSGIAVMKRENGRLSVLRFASLPSTTGIPFGPVLTQDEKQLIVPVGDFVHVLNVARLLSNASDTLLGSFHEGRGAGSVFVKLTDDDATLFVSDEWGKSITVIDFARARREGFNDAAIVGKIPTYVPEELAFSRDRKLLYAINQVAPTEWNWPETCTPEEPNAAFRLGLIRSPDAKHAEGAVITIDVARAKVEPATAVVGRVAAGCNPVRLWMQENGERFFVTARGSNALLGFDTIKLARMREIPVGTAPVALAVTRDGNRIFVGNSNRWGKGVGRTLSVVDGKKLVAIGTIPTGEFPRNIRLSPDEKTLFVTDYGDDTVHVVDLRQLPKLLLGR